jgi:hypothetical protein
MSGVFKLTDEKSPESPLCIVTSPWMKLTRATPRPLSFPASAVGEAGVGDGSGPGGAWAAAGITAKSTRNGIAKRPIRFVIMGHLIELPTMLWARSMPNRLIKEGLSCLDSVT